MNSAMMGMAHRGRLNVLVNIVGKSYEQLFSEFEGNVDPESIQGSGDVKYHLGQTGKFVSRAGNEIPVELAANPSHLEAVDPVVVGMARARMDSIEPPGNYPVLPILIHGDAAFAGQGVVAETLNLSQIKGYRVGGTIHLIINNQLGFTTPPEAARSSEYATDVAKMVQAPIFHVNGDDPEACVRVAQLAFDYRQAFHKDVVIDMLCYRRHGHNEGDDPSYTQPLMYKTHRGPAVGAQALHRGAGQAGRHLARGGREPRSRTSSAGCRPRSTRPARRAPASPLRGTRRPSRLGVLPHVETGVAATDARPGVRRARTPCPPGFHLHPKLAKQFETRARDVRAGRRGRLGARRGPGVRLAARRGHLGAALRRGQPAGHVLAPPRGAGRLRHRRGVRAATALSSADSARFWLYDSLLSEFAALGFEYGYSVENKDALVIWEAQFGDFMNGAQVIIDQFIVAAEDKWGQTSGLVMLLPHGYEGQGPEHSSARIERFLTLAAEDNIQVVQRDHRRAVLPPAAPPDAPRHPQAADRVHAEVAAASQVVAVADRELTHGLVRGGARRPGRHRPGRRAAGGVRIGQGRLIEARAGRDERGSRRSPSCASSSSTRGPTRRWPRCWPSTANANEIVWLQEEPENMGPWNSSRAGSTRPTATRHSITPGELAPSRAAPPPACWPSTSRSRTTSSQQILADLPA